MSKPKIAIFGASVTHQKDGYAVKLKSMFRDNVYIYGYGGMHLNDAGICFIDEVLQKDPSYCFIDWFSTDYNITDENTIEYIETLIHRFSEKECKLIFLFFPRKDYEKKKQFNLFCKRYLRQKNMYFMDLHEYVGIDKLDEILRDIVHTNDTGSKLYANIIYSKYIKSYENIKIPSNTVVNKYSSIQKIKVNKVFDKFLNLKGECEIIGFYLTVGPHSGIVEIVKDESSKKYNTWDVWCHYSRKHFSIPLVVNGIVQINILQENFDTSTCRKEYDFTNIDKKLIIHDIYFVGKFLNVENKSTGHRICDICNLNKKIMLRISQYSRAFLGQLRRIRG